jgi:hypothetical protein
MAITDIETTANYKLSSDSEQRIKARERLYKLSLETIGKIPQLDEPTEEETEWVNRRMRGKR